MHSRFSCFLRNRVGGDYPYKFSVGLGTRVFNKTIFVSFLISV